MNRSFRLLCMVAWVFVLGWAGLVFYLSSMSGQEIEHAMPFKFWDKAAHALAFATGGFLLAAALRVSAGWGWRAVIPLSIALVSLYGWTDEYHQQFTPGRSALDLGDWTADTLGAIVGSALCCACGFRKPRLSASPEPANGESPRREG